MTGDIVVVDDEPGTLKLLKILLENAGYEVRAFTSGTLALRSIRVKAPDLVMLDIRMPVLSGFDLCEKLKADPGSAEIPVIFLSSATDVEDKIKAFAVGGVDYITKPFEKAEVLARAGTHVTLFRTEQQNRLLARRLSSEIRTAAEYVSSTLPGDLAGPVRISSRYLPSAELGGDCFNYAWIDDDHLMIEMIDVSGHGIGAA